MKIRFELTTNIKIDAVNKAVKQAAETALKDTVVDIHHDTVEGSPWLTGNNARSIASEVGGLQGTVYGTSGYSGFLEVGTSRMNARPYFRPALDKFFTAEKVAERIRENLEAKT